MSNERAIRNATASLEMEGLYIDEEIRNLCLKLLQKEITMNEYIELVKRRAGVI